MPARRERHPGAIPMPTSVRALLIATAGFEAGAGIVLLVAPSRLTELLLGTGLGFPAAEEVARMTMARGTGAALVAVATFCWRERNARREAVSGLLVGLLFYNLAVPAILVSAALSADLSGIGLWPASLLHATLAGWCVACLRSAAAHDVRPDSARPSDR